MATRPKVLTSSNSTDGVLFVRDFIFSNKHKVPLYDVSTTSALNQIIGHAKFDNSSYGNVYYRGVNGLWDNVLPSHMRRNRGKDDDKVYNGRAIGLSKLIDEMCSNDLLRNSLKLRNIKTKLGVSSKMKRYNKYCAEALLQHYSGQTRFIDVVDNHWVALWMGLQDFIMKGEGNRSCHCQKREISIGGILETIASREKCQLDNIYVYILLLAMPYGKNITEYGIIETDELVEVDLRKAIPSTFLRPHAQHALVIGKRDIDPYSPKKRSHFDMASQVVAILRIRIDRASDWLGNGKLVSADNFFPSPSIDQGYNNLLKDVSDNEEEKLFKDPFIIIKYF